MSSILAAGESSDRPEDPLTTLDDDDELAPGEELRGMEIPNGFRLQISPPQNARRFFGRVWGAFSYG